MIERESPEGHRIAALIEALSEKEADWRQLKLEPNFRNYTDYGGTHDELAYSIYSDGSGMAMSMRGVLTDGFYVTNCPSYTYFAKHLETFLNDYEEFYKKKFEFHVKYIEKKYASGMPQDYGTEMPVDMWKDQLKLLSSFRPLINLIKASEIYKIENNKTELDITNAQTGKNIFIIHGHDDSAKNEIARFIETLGLIPIILHEQANKGLTIIEKVEAYTDVAYAIAIYTPDDEGCSLKQPRLKQSRARQNVVFEHGYLMGKIRRHKVAALVRGNIEYPSDISGVLYIKMDNDSWKLELAKEMQAAGCDFDLNKLIQK